MGDVIVYTGQAGTGKTYSLIAYLIEAIPKREWLNFETILALTFMHGSRKRLESKLKIIKTQFKIKSTCSTIDSFALSLVNRFRSYLGIERSINVNLENESKENKYELILPIETIQKYAVDLLQLDSVRKFISNSYPYIIIDEFQDCTGSRLEIVKKLTNATNILIAIDPFQYLSDTVDSEAMNWIIRNAFKIHNLDDGGIKRTSNNKILTTATCLRKGEKIDGGKIYIMLSASTPLTSYHLKTNIHYNLASGNIAIITPTQNCKFVTEAIDSLSSPYEFKKGKNKGKTIGPYDKLLGSDGFANIDELLKDIPKKDLNKTDLKDLAKDKNFIIRRSSEILLKKMSRRNSLNVCYEEVYFTFCQVIHSYNNFYRKENTSKIVLTTIHGAKNREFENVIVLWPYEVSGNLIKKRKLLYNAITRARRNVVVIVQHKNLDLQDLLNDELFNLIVDKDEETTN
jgi:superfamily I DNA/RNA helicase